MSRRRVARLNALLQEEIARALRRELKDPRVRCMTVTGVEVTPDLMHATVHVRTLPGEVAVEEAIAGLQSAEGYLRRLLGRELHLRRIPELRFEADRTLERARRIEDLLERARDEGDEDDLG